MASSNITCGHKKEDCFGYEKGECKVLVAHIEGKCPFYKTKKQVREERKKANDYL